MSDYKNTKLGKVISKYETPPNGIYIVNGTSRLYRTPSRIPIDMRPGYKPRTFWEKAGSDIIPLIAFTFIIFVGIINYLKFQIGPNPLISEPLIKIDLDRYMLIVRFGPPLQIRYAQVYLILITAERLLRINLTNLKKRVKIKMMTPIKIALDCNIGHKMIKLLQDNNFSIVTVAKEAESDHSWAHRAMIKKAKLVLSFDYDLVKLSLERNMFPIIIDHIELQNKEKLIHKLKKLRGMLK